MSTNLSWRDALKQFNDKRIQEGGKYTIPRKGTPEYASVRELMGEKSDAVELQSNQTVTGQTAPGKSTGKPRDPSKSRSPKKPTDSEEKIHKAVQTLVPTKDKPLWVDEPKPVEKKVKNKKPDVLQEFKPDDKGELVLVKETINPNKKKSKKKSVSTQTEPPTSPKSEDFIVKLK